jgi:hypothetical protein
LNTGDEETRRGENGFTTEKRRNGDAEEEMFDGASRRDPVELCIGFSVSLFLFVKPLPQ